MDDPPAVLARADGVLGELLLRRRTGDPGVLDLFSGGVHLMDTEESSTERRLAQEVLRHLTGSGLRVLVGGLGLGFTTGAVLADPRVTDVLVVEVEPALVGWLRAGLVPQAAGVLDDDRVRVVVADVRQVLSDQPAGALDAVLLDVDNGPGFLTHPSNAELYRAPALAGAAGALRPGGVLAVWSADPAPELAEVLSEVVGRCQEVALPVRRHGRDLTYWLYLATDRG